MGTGCFLGVKRPGRGVDHPPHLAPRWKSRVKPPFPLWAFVACSRVNFTLPWDIWKSNGRAVQSNLNCSY